MFAQAARTVVTLDEAERAGRQIERFSGIELTSDQGLSMLVQRGWQLCAIGGRPYALRSFEQAALTVVLEREPAIYNVERLKHCFVVPVAIPEPNATTVLPAPAPLRDLPALPLSEALADLVEISANPRYRPRP